MADIHANGITIHYECFGPPGCETILLIAGLGAQMIRWSVPFCQEMAARGFRVIRFDNRDAGLSTHFGECPAPEFGALSEALAQGRQPEAPYTLHDMTEDAIGLLDALSIERAHLVGRSMGGMIAQLAASEHPLRVMSLTSIMSSTGNPSLPGSAPDVMTMLTRQAPNPFVDEAGFAAHSLAFARRIASPGYPFDETANRALILEEVTRAYDPSGFGRQIAAIAVTGDIRSRLSKITVPTLVVHGADDPLVPLAAGKDTATSIYGAEFMVIEGMGHDLPPALYEMVVDAITWNARR
ncbi:alpha/beta fold hydrolase [Desulfolutivibrio sulfoxidireducens]|uniref:alpha/beta fold hydrolase n=1 Tax=Desulfolutivibrio sulfoxidireducens TaxID=2773299 RepID=UPI00159E7C97|nr:alpha/beta hydrolase [Desulfolutivibrio sulfoxidireducens]QLA18844.1 alpha/beta fold hydrolase [Desulfolutivibrio sulfoxidireducens]